MPWVLKNKVIYSLEEFHKLSIRIILSIKRFRMENQKDSTSTIIGACITGERNPIFIMFQLMLQTE